MLNRIVVICNRCHKEVIGMGSEDGTVGFYRRNKLWEKYMDKSENILCDNCMWKDINYLKDYDLDLIEKERK